MGVRIRKRKGIWEKKYQINNTKLSLKSRISEWRGPFAFYNFILSVAWIWCFCNQKMILSLSEECYQSSQREKGNVQLSVCYFPAALNAGLKRRYITAWLLRGPPSAPRTPGLSPTARTRTVTHARAKHALPQHCLCSCSQKTLAGPTRHCAFQSKTEHGCGAACPGRADSKWETEATKLTECNPKQPGWLQSSPCPQGMWSKTPGDACKRG